VLFSTVSSVEGTVDAFILSTHCQDRMMNLSISTLAEDSWWWRPDFLSFLQGLVKTVDVRVSLEEMESLLIW
jgi:hypothetical protein